MMPIGVDSADSERWGWTSLAGLVTADLSVAAALFFGLFKTIKMKHISLALRSSKVLSPT